MQVTFLGTADGHTSARREHSGIFIQFPDTSILLDCGASVARFLTQKKISADVPEMIWISHMHSDHVGQFTTLIQSLWLRGRHAPLHVYGPGGVVDALRLWLAHSLLFPELIGFPLHWHATEPGQVQKQGPLLLTAFATEHLSNLASHYQQQHPETCFACHGVLLEHQGQRTIYSADIAQPTDLIPPLKAGPIHALFCEMTHFPERDLFTEIAQHQVASLWITHYPDHLITQESQIQAWAKEAGYTGDVHLMHDRLCHEI